MLLLGNLLERPLSQGPFRTLLSILLPEIVNWRRCLHNHFGTLVLPIRHLGSVLADLGSKMHDTLASGISFSLISVRFRDHMLTAFLALWAKIRITFCVFVSSYFSYSLLGLNQIWNQPDHLCPPRGGLMQGWESEWSWWWRFP